MEITWFGHACFRLRAREGTVVTDPFGKESGYTMPQIRADVVTISHDHENHNQTKGFRGKPHIIHGPGEYEVKGIFVKGIATYHDNEHGKKFGRNTVYRYDLEKLTVAHLGDLGHILLQTQVEVLNSIDVLLIPVGGGATIGPTEAAEIVSLVEPRIVIPMHYKTPAYKGELQEVEKFLDQMGVKSVGSQDSLKVTVPSLPEETKVVLLTCTA